MLLSIGNGNEGQASGNNRQAVGNVENIYLHVMALQELLDFVIGAAGIALLEIASDKTWSGLPNSI